MPSSKEVYREACRRLHRALGNYFAIRAWCSGSDCLILQRIVIQKILEVERVKGIRMEWIREDFISWFPFIYALEYSGSYSVGSLYLSRVDISTHIWAKMTDENRVEMLNNSGVNTIVYDHNSNLPSNAEEFLTELNLMTAGIMPAPKVVFQSG